MQRAREREPQRKSTLSKSVAEVWQKVWQSQKCGSHKSVAGSRLLPGLLLALDVAAADLLALALAVTAALPDDREQGTDEGHHTSCN